ncbi:unnamed protein product [Pseudo-nitzschia multistriata]|uniref:SET domain-containing protein n=1 Tax=Pseudo-nitzschia multistriata TaxID=183589 RepID=A0A448ZNK4_9STRA|nr:unnamed protein product [Pseudo-nitzschia multistriata]
MMITLSYRLLFLSSISVLGSASIKGCLAWQEIRLAAAKIRRVEQSSRLFATKESSPVDSSLQGVDKFESWFSNVPGSECNPYIKHTSFGTLRGLGTQDKGIGSSSESWMTIPRSIVLESDFSQKDWDAQLAQSLWKEVMKESSGGNSSISGYVSLLTKSWSSDQLPETPPFTAPDALRHWTEEEKAVLSAHAEGQALVDLQKQQEKMWKDKFDRIKTMSGMTWEQFEWAMEAVHSRAFCGDFGIGGGSSMPLPVAVGTPALAALAGYFYYVQLHGQNDIILLALAAIGAIPSVLNLVNSSPPVAVLLPLIDSANHREDADSSIEYSPLTDSFGLTGGSNCLVTEDDGKQQLYISYGKKSDKELLLNYGFLNGVALNNEDNDSTRRKTLAEQFVANH